MLLGASGEEIARARALATQAREPAPHYEHMRVGYNYRRSNVSAAIGRGQLTAIAERVVRRRAIFDHYARGLGRLPGLALMPGLSAGRWRGRTGCPSRGSTCLNYNIRETIRAALRGRRVLVTGPAAAACSSGGATVVFTRRPPGRGPGARTPRAAG
jgi:hypothetical protein